MKLVCHHPHAPVDHPSIPGVSVNRGDVIDVEPKLAGTRPSDRFLAAEVALHKAAYAIPRVHEVEAAARDRLISLSAECGSGLLAAAERSGPTVTFHWTTPDDDPAAPETKPRKKDGK